MLFEEDNSVQVFGERVGYASAYLLFTTVLFIVLTLLSKLPASWSYLHVMGVTFSISLLGVVTRRFIG